jgi:hypothetical protein
MKVSADKMLVKAQGPVWHKKQKAQGIIPAGLRELDTEATWGVSGTDGWVYGHGSFCRTSQTLPVVGLFQWMPNSGHEAKRLESEIGRFHGVVQQVFVDRKADDQDLSFGFQRDDGIQLVTKPRNGMDNSLSRQPMIQEMLTPANVAEYKHRSTTVEPMQGLVKEIFGLATCWMRGNANNRWLFAAMGGAVQIAQWKAFQQNRSTWQVKTDVLGL